MGDKIIYVDGSHKSNAPPPGSKTPIPFPYGWGLVCNQDGRDMLPFYDISIKGMDKSNEIFIKPLDTPKKGMVTAIWVKDTTIDSQTQYAELVALIVGLVIAINRKIKTVASDSQTVVKYWSYGRVGKGAKLSSVRRDLIEQCGELRSQYEAMGGKIIQISGDDNEADPGWHR